MPFESTSDQELRYGGGEFPKPSVAVRVICQRKSCYKNMFVYANVVQGNVELQCLPNEDYSYTCGSSLHSDRWSHVMKQSSGIKMWLYNGAVPLEPIRYKPWTVNNIF